MSNILIQPVTQDEVCAHGDNFIELFEADRRRLYAYIVAFMGDKAAADDVFQETSLTLWREFHRFQVGTDFSKWANGIAFNRVRSYRRSAGRMPQLLSDDLLEKLDTRHQEISGVMDERWRILQECVTELPAPQEKIYREFYRNNKTAKDLASSTGRSIFAIRKSIHKLRKRLFDCVGLKCSGEVVEIVR